MRMGKKDAWAQGFSGDISGGSAFTIFTFCVLILLCLYLSGDIGRLICESQNHCGTTV